MREIGISPRFSRDKFVPLQTKQRYSTRDISGEVSLTLFFRGFVPFLSLADFVSRNKNLQVADLQRLKSCFGELVTATTSNHQKALFERNGRKPASGNPPQSGKERPQTGMTGRQHPAVPERPFGKSAATAQKTETLLGLVQQKAAGKEPEQPPRRQEHRRGRRHHTLGV